MHLVMPEQIPFLDEVVLAGTYGLRTEDGRVVHTVPVRKEPFPEDALLITDALDKALSFFDGGRLAILTPRRIPGATCMGCRDSGRLSMREIMSESLTDITDTFMGSLRDGGTLIVDLSVLDPVFAPGLDGCTPGGLTTRELLTIIQRCRLVKGLRSAAIVVRAAPGDADVMPSLRFASRAIVELV